MNRLLLVLEAIGQEYLPKDLQSLQTYVEKDFNPSTGAPCVEERSSSELSWHLRQLPRCSAVSGHIILIRLIVRKCDHFFKNDPELQLHVNRNPELNHVELLTLSKKIRFLDTPPLTDSSPHTEKVLFQPLHLLISYFSTGSFQNEVCHLCFPFGFGRRLRSYQAGRLHHRPQGL